MCFKRHTRINDGLVLHYMLSCKERGKSLSVTVCLYIDIAQKPLCTKSHGFLIFGPSSCESHYGWLFRRQEWLILVDYNNIKIIGNQNSCQKDRTKI